ncbi:gluconate 2-dehydrogenase subunit 3 family protein [Paenibacillus allorhizosphaerae]|uniref:Gluconate 2-dehydrogenase subunit 3 family protein n=1 Tax=Paenibacillus allorhizosphaerae TaxID=2849866 RepID=A0ABN7TT70_9BACL|nr:gluconate 2-dehydrogenase subunit 3 family protein [Paenibacillus allorhizosphaerae]CAG7650411.1 hypothetical protein PAECIP111802_04716 [Paenibacillus allorhizosphaerae]
MKRTSRYPFYDVMNEQRAWDDHTRHIVNSRVHTEGEYVFLMTVEAEMLRSWCSLLMDDNRPEVIQYVIDHFDQSLGSGKESQRKPGEPPLSQLVRGGLHALDQACQSMFTEHFFHLEAARQKQIMTDISEGQALPAEIWKPVPQTAFFQKMLSLTIDAYYSHPKIWSDIGYAGPAYPRGYVRMDLGQLDPWEPKEDTKKNEA